MQHLIGSLYVFDLKHSSQTLAKFRLSFEFLLKGVVHPKIKSQSSFFPNLCRSNPVWFTENVDIRHSFLSHEGGFFFFSEMYISQNWSQWFIHKLDWWLTDSQFNGENDYQSVTTFIFFSFVVFEAWTLQSCILVIGWRGGNPIYSSKYFQSCLTEVSGFGIWWW